MQKLITVLLWLLSGICLYLTLKEVGAQTEERKIFRLDSTNIVRAHYDILQLKGIKFPLVVLAQEVHETNWFTSTIYKENNNRFGMKTNSRPFDKGENRGHARYDSFEDSIKDYAGWQKARLKANPWVRTEEDYLKLLTKVGYAEDPKYIDKLRIHMRKIRLLEDRGGGLLVHPN